MENLPLIRIKYGRFLDRVFKLRFTEGYPDVSEIEQKVEKYKIIWKEYEYKILPAVCDILKLQFKQNIIDVYIVGKARAFSDPMVIPAHLPEDEFVDVLTHELLHRLISDNSANTIDKIGKQWDKIYDGEERLTLNHILVHAVSEYVYLEILKESSRLDRDIERCNNNPPYVRSWSIVKTKGYKNIIDEFFSMTNN